ncbi:MAG: undecaprenyl-diphosphate phosphatase [Candidatus Omnitrophica bacterium]|nr:undecaprenyl-diphosphate phosphatase [Candidatus Omnitrophota bacterium]MBU4478705.1 undecaprenyl-diphosphate phosphatase [Candidatus Omnitrophota bacterium]MCG2703162.1 undecaprenyl-diphosphate phosphatase [Candidatus Omnitrophota bacterium]
MPQGMHTVRFLFLAFVQGITEFLPVSSSGHLAIFQTMLGFKEPPLVFDIILHLATTLAVLIFLRKELALVCSESLQAFHGLRKGERLGVIWRKFPYYRMGVLVIVAFLPAATIGVLLHSLIEKMFASLMVVGISLLFTGTVLFMTKNVSSKKNIETMTSFDAVIVGIAQACAIVPGISRSGMTIAGGMFRKLDKNFAARFSFMLSIPTILAAAVYHLKNGIGDIFEGKKMILMLSFLIAFVTGYAALAFLSRLISRAKFHYFSYYCWGIGLVSILLAVKWPR